MIILFFVFIAALLNMTTILWIARNVFSVALVALVIVFQPELRRGLEFLGRGKLTRQFSLKQEDIAGTVGHIVDAVEYFSAKKEGAIIVVERETALQDIADTGTIIDAALSTPLLKNIFYKGSPLHDGAAILRSDRVLAAGCVLPLTQNKNLSKDLGTRHRAGLGISEISDAVAIIVSEETGIISIARDGKLSRFIDIKTVEKLLMNMYLNDQPEDDTLLAKFKNLLRRKDDAPESEED